MDIFWQLAEEDVATRQKAIVDLISQIENQQVVVPAKPSATPESNETKQVMTKDAILDYVLGRLVRGLGSSRQAARQGFSAALTQILHVFSDISTKKIVSLVTERANVSQNLSYQEKKDFAIGRVFFVLVLARANRIGELSTDEFLSLISHIVQLQTTNSHVDEICSEAIHTLVEASSKEQFEKSVIPAISSSFPESPSDLTASQLSIAIALRRGIDRYGFQSLLPSYVAKITSPETFPAIITPLTSTVSLFPGIHTVWTHLLEDLASRTDISKASTVSASNSALVLFWDIVVQNIFISSPAPNRKGLALNLLQIAIEILWRNSNDSSLTEEETKRRHTSFAVQVSALFVKDMTRIFIFQLRTKKSSAHASALELHNLLQQIASQSSTLAMSIMTMLTNPDNGGHRLFDQRSSSRLIHTIMTSLDSQGAEQYLSHLLETFQNAESLALEDIKAAAMQSVISAQEVNESEESAPKKRSLSSLETDAESIVTSPQGQASLVTATESIRVWALDQMVDMCKNSKKFAGFTTAAHEHRVSTVLNFILRHAYFKPKAQEETPAPAPAAPVSKKAKKSASKSTPTVDTFVSENPICTISENTRKICVMRLISGLSDAFNQVSALKNQNDDDEIDAEAEADVVPHYWAEKLHQYYETLVSKNYEFCEEMNEGATLAKSVTAKTLARLVSLIKENSPTDAKPFTTSDVRRKNLPKVRVLYNFILHIAILQCTDTEDYSPLLVDLDQIVMHAFPSKDKSMSDIVSDDQADEWIEVLVDLLLSLLIKPSALLRSLSLRVFGAFCDDITPGALADLTNVIISKPDQQQGQEAEQEVEVGEEDEEDEEDEADDADDEPLGGLDEEARAKAALIIEAAVKSGLVSLEDSKRWDPLSGHLPEDASDEEEEEVLDFGSALREGRTVSGERLGERMEQIEEINLDEMAELLGQDAFTSEMGLQTPQDLALQQLVKMKRARNQQQKDHRREAMNFKLRVLDLLEVIIKRRGSSELVLPLYHILPEAVRACNTTELRPLHDRMFALLKNKLYRSYPYTALPSEVGTPGADVATHFDALEHCFAACKKSSGHENLYMNVLALTRLVNIYISAPATKEEWASHNVVETKKSSSKKSSSKAAPVDTEAVLGKIRNQRIMKVNALFEEYLDLYFTSKRSSVNTRFFSDIITKSTPIAWPSLMKVAKYISTAPSTFLRIEAADFTSQLLRLRNSVSSKTLVEDLKSLKSIIDEAQTTALEGLTDKSEEDSEAEKGAKAAKAAKGAKGDKNKMKQGSAKTQKALQKSLKSLLNVYSSVMKKIEESK